ncbi:unnamed protein product, partial [Phaeothamnion confervicola]
DPRAASERLKQAGNDCMKRGRFTEAVDFYSRALTEDGGNTAALNNRTEAWLKLKRWGKAEADASEVLRRDPANHKALFR